MRQINVSLYETQIGASSKKRQMDMIKRFIYTFCKSVMMTIRHYLDAALDSYVTQSIIMMTLMMSGVCVFLSLHVCGHHDCMLLCVYVFTELTWTYRSSSWPPACERLDWPADD